jgi:hypothetical protein
MKCPSGTYQLGNGQAAASSCNTCTAGHYCPVDASIAECFIPSSQRCGPVADDTLAAPECAEFVNKLSTNTTNLVKCMGTPSMSKWKEIARGSGATGTLSPGVYRLDAYYDSDDNYSVVAIFDKQVSYKLAKSGDDIFVFIDTNNPKSFTSAYLTVRDVQCATNYVCTNTIFTPGMKYADYEKAHSTPIVYKLIP